MSQTLTAVIDTNKGTIRVVLFADTQPYPKQIGRAEKPHLTAGFLGAEGSC